MINICGREDPQQVALHQGQCPPTHAHQKETCVGWQDAVCVHRQTDRGSLSSHRPYGSTTPPSTGEVKRITSRMDTTGHVRYCTLWTLHSKETAARYIVFKYNIRNCTAAIFTVQSDSWSLVIQSWSLGHVGFYLDSPFSSFLFFFIYAFFLLF